jgi:hypothetical protein
MISLATPGQYAKLPSSRSQQHRRHLSFVGAVARKLLIRFGVVAGSRRLKREWPIGHLCGNRQVVYWRDKSSTDALPRGPSSRESLEEAVLVPCRPRGVVRTPLQQVVVDVRDNPVEGHRRACCEIFRSQQPSFLRADGDEQDGSRDSCASARIVPGSGNRGSGSLSAISAWTSSSVCPLPARSFDAPAVVRRRA